MRARASSNQQSSVVCWPPDRTRTRARTGHISAFADDDRATRRADTIRRRLGWEPGILNDNGLKLKGMHWRTCDRLKGEHNAHITLAVARMAAQLGLTEQWLRR